MASKLESALRSSGDRPRVSALVFKLYRRNPCGMGPIQVLGKICEAGKVLTVGQTFSPLTAGRVHGAARGVGGCAAGEGRAGGAGDAARPATRWGGP